jgi:hypothetical protein
MLLPLAACTPNQRIMQDSANRSLPPIETGTPASQMSDLEKDLKAMQDAQFLFVYVLRRKDGAPLNADDKRYAGQVIPQEMNRRVVSDQGRAVVIGSNFRLPPDIQKVLTDRFAFEDRSQQQDAPAR